MQKYLEMFSFHDATGESQIPAFYDISTWPPGRDGGIMELLVKNPLCALCLIKLCLSGCSRRAPCFCCTCTRACVQKTMWTLPLADSRDTPCEIPNPNQCSSVVDNLLTWYPIIWISLWNYLCVLHSSSVLSCVCFLILKSLSSWRQHANL